MNVNEFDDPVSLLTRAQGLASEKRRARAAAREAYALGASLEELERLDAAAEAGEAKLRHWLSSNGRKMGVFVEAQSVRVP